MQNMYLIQVRCEVVLTIVQSIKIEVNETIHKCGQHKETYFHSKFYINPDKKLTVKSHTLNLEVLTLRKCDENYAWSSTK